MIDIPDPVLWVGAIWLALVLSIIVSFGLLKSPMKREEDEAYRRFIQSGGDPADWT